MRNQDVYKREEKKSNFGLMNIVDPIGLFGGKPLWALGASKEEKAAYRYQQQQLADQQRMEQKMRNIAIREQSAANAYEIRKQLKRGESSAKLKSRLMISGIVVTTLLIGGIVAYKIIKK